MTEIILKNNIEQSKMEALLLFLKSWGIDAEVKKSVSKIKNTSKITLNAGMWENYNIDAADLRRKAWERTK